ncbi:hypothetical protein O3M35_006241 [Rhynocoris fuscipes]|uniref:Uncharacterized protein n=1 Tax=Rhynocoris fuscipes TaxID=488301 RepID=A0AAW1DCM0_9HEMI
MLDTKFANLSCSVGNTVVPIDLKFRYNLRNAMLHRMQKVASKYLQKLLRYRSKFFPNPDTQTDG